ncbi:antibiotic biosynthesis monooxygenase family protein [Piscinibacter gummiphilus]|nr:antibiotic biosynthesis monooxygenase family protein [Piscinibacter gummiphilus]ATU66965.1 antibiotic biosynthesis monooxygenase [Piscinibacter gummiphilus]GLS94384.1 hypothetical protein GCM10007918_16760 [Piscinibacter gummiphilus]
MVEGRSHARMGTFEVPPAALDEVVALFRDRVVPAFSRHDGFLGYEAFTDRDSGCYVGLSFWASREALDASGDTAREARDEAAALGAVTVGTPRILALAFDSRLPLAGGG